MHKVLIDTCVWLDLAKDYREEPVLHALEDLVKAQEVRLMVPQIVLDEFARNKTRIIEDSQRSLSSHFKLVKQAVNRFADGGVKDATLAALSEVDHRIGTKGEAVNDMVDAIETLLKTATPVATSDAVLAKVAARGIAKVAPFHKGKNSAADAALIEIYAEQRAAGATPDDDPDGLTWSFITHNTKDFGNDTGDVRQPHPDLQPMFDGTSSSFYTSLVKFIQHIDPVLLADHDSEFSMMPDYRRLSEILEAEQLLFKQVWYNRHWNLRSAIEEGTHKVLPEGEYSRTPYKNDETLDTVWAGALAAAKKTEDEVGLENLGPWDDFEWGMINGKLSALRWVLGDDWDMLDT